MKTSEEAKEPEKKKIEWEHIKDQEVYCHKCNRRMRFWQFWEAKFYDNKGKLTSKILEVELLCVGCGYKPHLFKEVKRDG